MSFQLQDFWMQASIQRHSISEKPLKPEYQAPDASSSGTWSVVHSPPVFPAKISLASSHPGRELASMLVGEGSVRAGEVPRSKLGEAPLAALAGSPCAS